MFRGENIFPKNMISRGPVYIIYVKTDSTVKNREYAFAKTFESIFDEDTFFNSTVCGTSLAVGTPILGTPADYLDSSKFTRVTEEKNPCWAESKVRIHIIS